MFHNYKNVSQIYIYSSFYFLGYSLEFPIQIQHVPQKFNSCLVIIAPLANLILFLKIMLSSILYVTNA